MVDIRDAAKCPKCGVLGELTSSRAALDESGKPCDIATYNCVTELCRWFGTGWVVQSDARGEIFERNQGPRGQDKTFPLLTPDQLARGRMAVEQAAEREDRPNG